ncbi:hypothetical protein ILYODFUR_036889 [Ilyodon furcidens]|uniref:Uncharacterized protein n=1 Tax=Ilyodon furcidens TaxID=33524 RepID=A0ABV0U188_9TELE
MNLPGCDKVVLKNSINGSRFVNLTDNDLQKFPKLHAPMISKLSSEIHKNVKKGGLFGKKYVLMHTNRKYNDTKIPFNSFKHSFINDALTYDNIPGKNLKYGTISAEDSQSAFCPSYRTLLAVRRLGAPPVLGHHEAITHFI